MKNRVLIFLLMSSVFTLAKSKEERRQHIDNSSAYPVKITLHQTGKACKKKKEWVIAPGKKETIFMYENCRPQAMNLTFPKHSTMQFTSQGLSGKGKAEFSTKAQNEYIYWDITVEGKSEPVSINAIPHQYVARREERKKRRTEHQMAREERHARRGSISLPSANLLLFSAL